MTTTFSSTAAPITKFKTTTLLTHYFDVMSKDGRGLVFSPEHVRLAQLCLQEFYEVLSAYEFHDLELSGKDKQGNTHSFQISGSISTRLNIQESGTFWPWLPPEGLLDRELRDPAGTCDGIGGVTLLPTPDNIRVRPIRERTLEGLQTLKPGDFVKIRREYIDVKKGHTSERFWLVVRSVIDDDWLTGEINNKMHGTETHGLKMGDMMKIELGEVLDVIVRDNDLSEIQHADRLRGL